MSAAAPGAAAYSSSARTAMYRPQRSSSARPATMPPPSSTKCGLKMTGSPQATRARAAARSGAPMSIHWSQTSAALPRSASGIRWVGRLPTTPSTAPPAPLDDDRAAGQQQRIDAAQLVEVDEALLVDPGHLQADLVGVSGHDDVRRAARVDRGGDVAEHVGLGGGDRRRRARARPPARVARNPLGPEAVTRSRRNPLSAVITPSSSSRARTILPNGGARRRPAVRAGRGCPHRPTASLPAPISVHASRLSQRTTVQRFIAVVWWLW